MAEEVPEAELDIREYLIRVIGPLAQHPRIQRGHIDGIPLMSHVGIHSRKLIDDTYDLIHQMADVDDADKLAIWQACVHQIDVWMNG